MAKLEKEILELVSQHPIPEALAATSAVMIAICVTARLGKDETFAVLSKQWDRIKTEIETVAEKRRAEEERKH